MLGLSEGRLGGQDAPDGFPASGRNAYPSGANAFFADVGNGGGQGQGQGTLKSMARPMTFSRAGRGIGPGACVFQGPGGPVTNTTDDPVS